MGGNGRGTAANVSAADAARDSHRQSDEWRSRGAIGERQCEGLGRERLSDVRYSSASAVSSASRARQLQQCAADATDAVSAADPTSAATAGTRPSASSEWPIPQQQLTLNAFKEWPLAFYYLINSSAHCL